MSITIKDVAKEAGVSVATVSRVLNGSCNVSDESTKKVNETIARLNYSPNFLGRNLRKCETNVILVIMPTSETRQMNMLFNRTVDGVILLGTQYDAASLNKLAENYNVALCCEGVEGANVLTVAVDDEQAAFDAVAALIKKGHKRIGFIGTNSAAISSTARENGYIRALKEYGIEIKNEYIYKESYDYDCGGRAFEYFNALDEKPTAIFAVSDLLAISAMHKAIDMDIDVGKDVAIMGFDNISMCEWIIPTLSTVEQPCSKMGELVVAKLIENMNKTTKDNHYYTVDHRIILRESTGD